MTQEDKMHSAHHKLHALAWMIIASMLWALHEPHYAFSDPVAYLNLANSIDTVQSWSMDNPFQHRLGLVGLHSLSLSLFGINPFGIFAPQLVVFLCCIGLVSAFCRTHQDLFIANLTVMLMLPQARTIFPDMAAAMFMISAMLAMAPRTGALRGALFSIMAVAAFLFKETAIFIVLPFVVILAADARDIMRNRGRRHFYLGVLGTGIGLVAVYLMSYLVVWGDPFLRLSSVSSYGQLHLWSVSGRLALLERLFVEPLPQMQRVIGAAFVLSLLSALYFLTRPRPSGQPPLSGGAYVAIFHLGWVAAFAFGTTSLSSYQPLPFLDRMLDPVVMTSAILCAYGLRHLAEVMRTQQRLSAAALVTLCVILIGHKALENIAASVAFSYVSNVHEARQNAATMITDDPQARLVVAERRTRTLFPVYTNYEDRRSQILDCSGLDAPQSAPVAYLVDYRAVTLIGNVHGIETCITEVRTAAQRAGARVIYDDDRLFFAVKAGG